MSVFLFLLVAMAGLVLLIVLLAGFVIGVYNRLIRLGNQCDASWANIQTELQRRYDLIPNLVNTVKGYAAHERELLEEVTRLREQCVANQGSPQEQAATESLLQGALGRLMVRLERYPDLKANQNFLDLQAQLADTENRIQMANSMYNATVRDFNNAVMVFPANMVAMVYAFKPRQFFELGTEAARQAPQVQF
ncbi:MAG TPA: LemA family protein [Candidatus Hydrogenedentes bacterium]|nr:LemA family protein [Candidatus Hydrogenedentota bacterium]HOL75872.1 LemA family protein [Candidatus Hydrogenedentota bacterium]HPO86373.1 LemA family protein [Candidatus Hydrogenedentota bacterium]